MIRPVTWIVLILFIVLLGAALYLQNRPPQAEEAGVTPTPGPQALFDLDISSVIGLRIISSEGKILDLARDDAGNWTLVQPSTTGEPDVQTIETGLSSLLSLSPMTGLNAAPALDIIGLITPQYVVTVVRADGRQYVLEVGNKTPTSNGYYARFDNGNVIVVNQFSLQSLFDMLTTLPILPTLEPTAQE
jgi:hypothetical protein